MTANPQSPHSEAVQENIHRYFAGRYRQLGILAREAGSYEPELHRSRTTPCASPC